MNAIAGRTLAGWSPRARAGPGTARVCLCKRRFETSVARPCPRQRARLRQGASHDRIRHGWAGAAGLRFGDIPIAGDQGCGRGWRGLGPGAAESTLHRQPSVLARRGAGPASRRQARLGPTPGRLLRRQDGPPAGRLLRDAGTHRGRRRPRSCCRPDASVRGLGSARLLLSSRRRGTGRLQGRHLDSCARRPWSVQAGGSGVDADRLCVGRSRILHAVAPASLSATGAIPVAGGAGTGRGLPKRRSLPDVAGLAPSMHRVAFGQPLLLHARNARHQIPNGRLSADRPSPRVRSVFNWPGRSLPDAALAEGGALDPRTASR